MLDHVSDVTLLLQSLTAAEDGSTIVTLVNGSVWQQDEYYYRYQFKYRPKVTVDAN